MDILAKIFYKIFLSTPSVGRATPGHCGRCVPRRISIHALRGEGDTAAWHIWQLRHHFYPRPPWGGRHRRGGLIGGAKYFYPRPPWGGRRFRCHRCIPPGKYFYPRPPWGGRREMGDGFTVILSFLSTPSVGRATTETIASEIPERFLSTPSVGRATAFSLLLFVVLCYFYPRPPWGGRRRGGAIFKINKLISIHALRGEGDKRGGRTGAQVGNFYPRPPWGGRPNGQRPCCKR